MDLPTVLELAFYLTCIAWVYCVLYWMDTDSDILRYSIYGLIPVALSSELLARYSGSNARAYERKIVVIRTPEEEIADALVNHWDEAEGFEDLDEDE